MALSKLSVQELCDKLEALPAFGELNRTLVPTYKSDPLPEGAKFKMLVSSLIMLTNIGGELHIGMGRNKKDRFTLPGGKCDKKRADGEPETLGQALVRELCEEVRHVAPLFTDDEWNTAFSNAQDERFHVVGNAARVGAQPIEHTWFTISVIVQLPTKQMAIPDAEVAAEEKADKEQLSDFCWVPVSSIYHANFATEAEPDPTGAINRLIEFTAQSREAQNATPKEAWPLKYDQWFKNDADGDRIQARTVGGEQIQVTAEAFTLRTLLLAYDAIMGCGHVQ